MNGAAPQTHPSAGRVSCSRLALSGRQRTLLTAALAALALGVIVAAGVLLPDTRLATDLGARNQAPSLANPFGTDWLGRDMLTRTARGLTTSLALGMAAASVSALLALALGMAAATLGKAADAAVSWLIDLFLSVPHIVLLILISFAFGGGACGVIIGIVLTHWPALARIIRAEILALRGSEFVRVSRRLGRSNLHIATRHMFPHVFPQFLVGLILLFPHAILHEAAVTFLGFGLPPHEPAVGIILAEAMMHLSTGRWWLALFPGLALLAMVRAFDILGDNTRALLDPRTAHE
ncbi:MAG: ABC transporter permease [Actinobacteria bacterium]|nr:ABC transporter permease [Actinomycetota bacterium]